MMTIANSQGGKTEIENFMLADRLREESNGEVEEAADLMETLRKIFPPAPPVPPAPQGPPPEGE